MRKAILALSLALIACISAQAQIVQLGNTANTSAIEDYASLELQRYYYQLSGELLTIAKQNEISADTRFVIGTLDNPLLRQWKEQGVLSVEELPGSQGYLIQTVKLHGRPVLLIAGADSDGMLYGVYGLFEDHLGVRYYMSGDIFPQKRLKGALPVINDVRTPSMRIRGFLPWTNFPQSATIYSWDDWKYIIDQSAKMRMNFIMIHNYNGFCGHNELFHNFEYNQYLSRGWMPTVKTGHGWLCPGWDINEYRFGASEIYDDYDFGADYGLHNETLTNSQIKEKGQVSFRKVIAYAHKRGVKIGLGLDIDVLLPEYRVEADDDGVITAQVKQLADWYPDLDYLLCFQSEGSKDSVFYAKWQRVFDGFYTKMKALSPATRIAVSGWGMTAESVAKLPEDVICAPISYYSAEFESGSIYGDREYWGCPWLERDWSSSQYYYPYNINLSETIDAYRNAADNMKGFYALTWRLTDAVSPKMWYISKAPWYDAERLQTSYQVYNDYARNNYGEKVAEPITSIINQNEPFATDFAECQATPKFEQAATTYPLINISSIELVGNDKTIRKISAVDYREKNGTKNAPCDEGGECVGYITDGNWLKYESVSLNKEVTHMAIRAAAASNGGLVEVSSNTIDGPVIASFKVNNTGGWQSWQTFTVPVNPVNQDVQTLYVKFYSFNKVANAKEQAESQLAVIDSCYRKIDDAGARLRLSYLRARLEGTRDHILLNSEFESYTWDKLPGLMDDWVHSFLSRIDDISSFGNIMSIQNRFIQQNYVEKVKQLAKFQRVKAPSHIVAQGTRDGAVVTWKNEEPGAEYFVVCRNGEELATLPVDVLSYKDNFDGKASYSVYVIDSDGNKSVPGIPYSCLAGDADSVPPTIIVTSPVTSVFKGRDLHVKCAIVDNRMSDDLSVTLYYRVIGGKKWTAVPCDHKSRSVFGITVSAEELQCPGIEYYLEASDSKNSACFPVEGKLRPHTVMIQNLNDETEVAAPTIQVAAGNRIKWEAVPDADIYRIYRSRSSDFDASTVSFLTFVGGQTTSFKANGFDRDGKPLKGTYYYCIKAVNPSDMESPASNVVAVEY